MTRASKKLRPCLARAGQLLRVYRPWLSLAGRRLDDYCRVSNDKGLDSRLGTIGADCRRSATAIYGADGPLPARLAELGTVLGHAGWADFFSYGAPLTRQGACNPSVRRSPANGSPRQYRVGRRPCRQPESVRTGCSPSAGPAAAIRPIRMDARRPVALRSASFPEPPGTASRYCHPVGCRYADTVALAGATGSRSARPSGWCW
jgi:hypothetical protein